MAKRWHEYITTRNAVIAGFFAILASVAGALILRGGAGPAINFSGMRGGTAVVTLGPGSTVSPGAPISQIGAVDMSTAERGGSAGGTARPIVDHDLPSGPARPNSTPSQETPRAPTFPATSAPLCGVGDLAKAKAILPWTDEGEAIRVGETLWRKECVTDQYRNVPERIQEANTKLGANDAKWRLPTWADLQQLSISSTAEY